MNISITEGRNVVKSSLKHIKRPRIKNWQIATASTGIDSAIPIKIGKYGVMPSSFEDCSEPLFYEMKQALKSQDEFNNFFRNEELYDSEIDEKSYLYSQYSYDDIPLSDSLILQYNAPIPNECYPDTKMEKKDETTLLQLNFIEHIIPSTIGTCRNNVDYSIIKKIATFCAESMGKGLPQQQLIQLIKMCVLKHADNMKDIPSHDLLKFLTKYPQNRNVVVQTNSKGAEIFDENASIYLPKFYNMFNNTKEAISVLNECRVMDSDGFKLVDQKLCKIVMKLRQAPKTNILHGSEQNKKIYNQNKPWTKEETELLQKLANDKKLSPIKCLAVEYMIEDKKPISFMLQNNVYYKRAMEIEKILKGINRTHSNNKDTIIKDVKHKLLSNFEIQRRNGTLKENDSKICKLLNLVSTPEAPKVSQIYKILNY